MKLLISGIVKDEGGITALYEKCVKLNSSTAGPFDVLFATFEISSSWLNDFIERGNSFPFKVYFALESGREDFIPKSLTSKGGDIGCNLYYLGQATIKDINGLSVASISGKYVEQDKSSVLHYNKKVIDEFSSSTQTIRDFSGVDIFISASWSQGVTNKLAALEKPEGVDEKALSTMNEIHSASLAMVLKPRYHFSCSNVGVFWQRTPYRNGVMGHITRYISLGVVDSSNTAKDKKWIHALNLVPLKEMDRATLISQPEGTTDNPYVSAPSAMKRSLPDDSSSIVENKRYKTDTGFSAEKAAQLAQEARSGGNQIRFNNTGGAEGKPLIIGAPSAMPHSSAPRVQGPPQRINCWFCLATAEVEKHLIAGIGNETYLATPKGSMVRNHILIIPIQHVASSTLVSETCTNEISSLIEALRLLYKSYGHVPIVCERYVAVKGANHGHLQVFPVPMDIAESLEGLFMKKGEKYDMKFEEIPSGKRLKDVLAKGEQYFYLELPDKKLLYRKPEESRHPVEFGREVIAEALRMPQRRGWKMCAVAAEEETVQTNDFKKEFKPFNSIPDFSLMP